jgi:hypothetical protein
LNAFGCAQTASNPFICVPAIPNSVLALTNDATWTAARFGVVSQWNLGYGFSVTAEAAWLPIGILSASDFHWLRPDLIKPIPENGAAFDQFQLEGLLAYQFTSNFSVGAGARYWRIGTTSAEADFTGGPVGAQSIILERSNGVALCRQVINSAGSDRLCGKSAGIEVGKELPRSEMSDIPLPTAYGVYVLSNGNLTALGLLPI